MLSNTSVYNTLYNDDDINNYNCIQGQQLTEQELNKINIVLNFDFKAAKSRTKASLDYSLFYIYDYYYILR